jgi:hypothetical protein
MTNQISQIIQKSNPICPICYNQLTQITKPQYVDFSCISDDHQFFQRIAFNQISKIKIKFPNPNIYIKINYDEGTSQIWSDKISNRRNFDQIIDLDFSNPDSIRQKIQIELICQKN